MEGDIKEKIRRKWSRLKDELSASSPAIADIALENNILNFADLETIATDPPVEKIHFILLRVVKLNKCELFLEVIEKKGFKHLCNEVQNTGIHTENQTHMEKGVTKLDQRLNDSQTQIEQMNNQFKNALASAKALYKASQSAHQHAKDEINRLALLMKQNTLENAKPSSQTKQLNDSVEKTKHTPYKELEEMEKELENLKKTLKQKDKIIDFLKTEKSDIHAQFLEKESELKKMIAKNASLEKKLQSEFTDIVGGFDYSAIGYEENVPRKKTDAGNGARPKNTKPTLPKEKKPSVLGNKDSHQQKKAKVYIKK